MNRRSLFKTLGAAVVVAPVALVAASETAKAEPENYHLTAMSLAELDGAMMSFREFREMLPVVTD